MSDDTGGGDIRGRAFRFAVRIVRLCRALERQGGVGRALGWQLIGSGTGIGANLEEAQASRSRADFISTCSVSCREARETLYWLRLIVASGVMPERRIGALITEANELVAILTTIINRARTNA